MHSVLLLHICVSSEILSVSLNMTRTQEQEHKKRSTKKSMEELPIGENQPALCLAYLILTGASCWAIHSISASRIFAISAFAFLLAHAVIGLLHTTQSDPSALVRKLYKQTCILAEVVPLALINAEFYMMTGYPIECAYVHVASGFVPLITYEAMGANTRAMMDLTILANLGSLVYLYVVEQLSVWICGLIALVTINHYCFKQICTKYNVPKVEIVSIGQIFFAVFATNGLQNIRG